MGDRVSNRRGDGEQLRDVLLRAATDLVVAPQELAPPSLRAIARASGVAPSAVYLHFASQVELLDAVIAEQYDELRQAINEGDDPDAGPVDRLLLLADAYVAWGLAHPGAYQLLFERPDVLPGDHPTGAGPDDAVGPGLDLLERVADLVAAAHASPQPEHGAALRVWAALHGLVSLRLHKQGAPWRDTAVADGRAIVLGVLHAGDGAGNA